MVTDQLTSIIAPSRSSVYGSRRPMSKKPVLFLSNWDNETLGTLGVFMTFISERRDKGPVRRLQTLVRQHAPDKS
jgi:hypothetical protein